jgi:hypothetical protein
MPTLVPASALLIPAEIPAQDAFSRCRRISGRPEDRIAGLSVCLLTIHAG